MSRTNSMIGRLPTVAATIAAIAFGTAVSAETIKLIRPSQAESLQNSGVSMTVYYLSQAGPIEVVATFGERMSKKPASQLRMSLSDGDDIEFFVPGRPGVSFQFVRSGSLVEVRSNAGDPASAATN